jgi:hypothetical protein
MMISSTDLKLPFHLIIASMRSEALYSNIQGKQATELPVFLTRGTSTIKAPADIKNEGNARIM